MIEPILMPDWSVNPAYTYKGGCRLKRPMRPDEEVTVDVVCESVTRANESIEKCLWEEALFDLDTAMALMPTHPIVRWNRGHVLLAMGRYAEGFAEYEWRFPLLGDQSVQTGIPRWRGEDVAGKRILVAHEWGYGDSFMLARFIPVFKSMGAEVVLALPRSLHKLFEQFDVEVLKTEYQNPRHYDYHLPIFSALTHLVKSPRDIPPSPYLVADKSKSVIVDKPAIGIAWSGDRDNCRDKHRSIDIELFLTSLKTYGYRLHSIQTSEICDAEKLGIDTPFYEDWTDTANSIMACDHIISVDTAPAHLAAALGHPSVHILVSCSTYWPWYKSKIWYPTANVYRQSSPGDWAGVFALVNAKLNR